MSLFVSTHTNKVDRKGRVSVPAQWRAALANQSFAGVVCLPNFRGQPCLDGMGFNRLEAMAEGMDGNDLFSEEQDALTQLVFASARQLPFDTEGRIMLPADFLEIAGITEQASFVGKGREFQIWEPAAHAAHMAEIRRRALEKRPSLKLKGGDE